MRLNDKLKTSQNQQVTQIVDHSKNDLQFWKFNHVLFGNMFGSNLMNIDPLALDLFPPQVHVA